MTFLKRATPSSVPENCQLGADPIRSGIAIRHIGFRSGVIGVLVALVTGLALSTGSSVANADVLGRKVAAKGVSMTVPSTWNVFSVDDPKLDKILKEAKKANPQFTLAPESMKASGIVIFAVNRKPKDPSFADNVNVVVVDNAPASLKGADKELKNVLESQGAIVTSQRNQKSGGQDALRTEYKLGINSPTGKKVTTFGTQLVTIKNSKMAIVTVSLSATDAVFVDSLLGSLKFA